MFLPDYAQKAIKILQTGGYDGCAVGGCVRDALSGKEPEDYDIAVSSEPEETKRCFADYRCIETGIKHGTVTVILDGYPLELTTFRRDGTYRDNRHPEGVTFTRDIENDLSRRDFTVNAMAYSPERGLIDLFGGQADLKHGIIRCVGDPCRRFEEDALRIMRCVRFASVLGFAVEPATARAALDRAELLKNISAERVFTELKKLLNGKNAGAVLLQYRKILEAALPELKTVSETDWQFLSRNMSRFSDPAQKVTLLLSPLGAEEAAVALAALKTDNRQRKTTFFLLENAERAFLSVGEVKRFAGEAGTDRLRMLFDYRKTVGKTDDVLLLSGIKAAERKNVCLKIADLAVNGQEIAALGFKGKEIGAALDRLLEAVTDGRAENEKKALFDFLTEREK